MTRRSFFPAGAGLLAANARAAGPKTHYLELGWFRFRNSPANQFRRAQEFLGKHYLPAARRAGMGALGFFTGVVAPDGPFVLMVLDFPTWAAIAEYYDKLSADKDLMAAYDQYASGPDIPYVRVESSLLRAFDSVPQIEPPPTEPGRPARIFELRVYESNTDKTLAKKIEMFDKGEVAIFRRTGLMPVFFGQTIVGTNVPNLTYMVAFDDLAAREKNWRAFGSDPEWRKLAAAPGYSDAEIVSNISNLILRPLAFSPIR